MPVFPGTLQLQVYGEVVSVQMSVPLTRNLTCVTPTLSDALAAIVTVLPLFTFAPFKGEVIATIGGMISGLIIGVGVGVKVGAGVVVGSGVGVGVLVGEGVGVTV